MIRLINYNYHQRDTGNKITIAIYLVSYEFLSQVAVSTINYTHVICLLEGHHTSRKSEKFNDIFS